MIDHNGKSVAAINKSNCKGCGMCLPVCPSDSIELISFTNKEMESMIDVLAQ
jgi:heterodisulfide reductase subunit A